MTRARVVAALLGLGFLASIVTGRYLLLVRPWFVWMFLTTGLVLILVAVRTRVAMTRWAAACLLLPLVVGFGLPPDAASRATLVAEGSDPLDIGAGNGENPLLDGSSGSVDILDILIAERQLGTSALHGRRVRAVGVVSAGNQLSRLVMVCCTADARPVSIPVEGALPEEGTWVEVDGTLLARGAAIIIRADRVTTVAEPPDPFL